MRIGINTLFMAPGRVGGTETYLRNLISELKAIDGENEYTIFTSRDNDATFEFPADSNFRKVALPGRSKGPSRLIAEQFLLPRLIRQQRLDVVHHPGGVLPLLSRATTVLTIHDLQHLHYPANFSRLKRLYLSLMVPLSVRKAHRIIAVSQFTAKDIAQRLGVAMEKIRVTWLAAGDRFSAASSPLDSEVYQRHGVTPPYVLSVAATHPHKNLDGLLAACALLRQRGLRLNLVLAGSPMSFHSKLASLIDASTLRDQVKLLGYVQDSDLPALYRGARVFAFPSMFEGFGIPALEAMASGVPLLAARRASLPEVAGDAALWVEPDPEDLAKGLEQLWTNDDLRAKVRKLGFKRVKQFSFQTMAEQTLSVYKEAVALNEGKHQDPKDAVP